MRINVFRIEKELAQQTLTKKILAEKMGIGRQNITTILKRGTCEPKTAGRIAAALDIPVSEIIQQPESEMQHEDRQ